MVITAALLHCWFCCNLLADCKSAKRKECSCNMLHMDDPLSTLTWLHARARIRHRGAEQQCLRQRNGACAASSRTLGAGEAGTKPISFTAAITPLEQDGSRSRFIYYAANMSGVAHHAARYQHSSELDVLLGGSRALQDRDLYTNHRGKMAYLTFAILDYVTAIWHRMLMSA
eukprot:3254888-Pleurochrysis_carterae.AAC.2